jgi:uncharacterized protein (TIGR00661 family)
MRSQSYDLVITDQEPITAWYAKKNNVESIGIGNVYSLETCTLKRLWVNKMLTKLFQKCYCPVTNKIILDFTKKKSTNFYPVINSELKKLRIKTHEFTLVYVLSYSLEELINIFSSPILCDNKFVIYTKEVQVPVVYKNIVAKPISKTSFTKDISNCKNIITTAGFQTIAEAVYLHKDILLIPIKGQPEQKANALMLREYNIQFIKKLKANHIKNWIEFHPSNSIIIKDETNRLVKSILAYIQ